MTEQAVMIEDEDLIDEPELDLDEIEEPEVDDEEADIEPEVSEEEDQDDSEEDDEVVVQIGEESPPQEEDDREAPEWVKDLRKVHREQQRENRQLKKQLAELQGSKQAEAQTQLGKKPTLEDADYDAEVYEQKLTDWYEKKRQYEQQQAELESQQRKQQEAWQATLQGYAEKRQTLKVRDFDDAESVVQDELSNTQQGMILQGAENPALVVYALGKNPKKAKEIASIQDPVKFAFAVAKLETQLKVTNRKAATKPETTLKGKAPKSGTVDSNLERLRAEAERTGDYTKVIAYKNQKRAAN